MHSHVVPSDSSPRTNPRMNFVDYIRGGCQISLMVAVDFTVSLCSNISKESLGFNVMLWNVTKSVSGVQWKFL